MTVDEIMTTEVLTVAPDTSIDRIAEILDVWGISGVPVVDEDRHVLGIVSEMDFTATSTARNAGEAMTAPAVTVTGSRRADFAAALMLDNRVSRLPVVDEDNVLVGIVTRTDLVRALVHTDTAIATEIRQEVLLRELWLRPDDFEVTVNGGEVTIAGHLPNEDDRELLVARVELVPGVVSVKVQETMHV